MRVAVLVPNDDAIARLAPHARKSFTGAGHEVVLLAHPAETLRGTFRSRRRRVGFLTALDEAAYSVYEGRYTPWKGALERLGLEAFSDFDARVQDTRTEELGDCLQALSADVLVAVGCAPINIRAFPPSLLALNIHPGVLPRYRGVGSPEAIMRGEPSHVGYTVHRLTERLDEGEFLLRKRCQTPLDFNAPWVYVSAYQAALSMLARRIGDASSRIWPLEDDFADSPPPEGRPMWRMTLSCVWSRRVKALFGAP